jgi:hypothetical protein
MEGNAKLIAIKGGYKMETLLFYLKFVQKRMPEHYLAMRI